MRILIAGTHAEKLANIRERSSLEEQIKALSSNVLRTAIDEVSSHMNHVVSRPHDNNISKKLRMLYQLLSNLRSATIRVVTLGCLVPDEDLPILSDLAVELLLPSATLTYSLVSQSLLTFSRIIIICNYRRRCTAEAFRRLVLHFFLAYCVTQ